MPNRLRNVTLIVAAAALLVAAVPGPVFAGDKVAVFKIKGAVPESPTAMDMSALFRSEPPVTMFGLLEKLRDARSDPEVQAVVFDIEQAGLGFAQIQELRTQFEALRAADKDVLVYVETLHPGTLLLGSAATRLVMMPAGLLDFTGLYGEALYFKNMLDKIGLEADIIHCGEFKSAGEPFYRTGPSEAAEKQQNSLLDSIFEQILADIARSRRLSPEAVRKLVDQGVFHAKDALEAKLVDDLQYREDFIKTVRRKYGKDTKVVFDYGKEKGPNIDFDSLGGLIQFVSEIMKGPTKSTKPAVAVVFVEGPIVSGEDEPGIFGPSGNAASGTIRRAIATAAKDKSVKALVLRVNSPGGSAIASEVICEATKRFSNSGRPFIVTMGNVAASGGYYVATQADTIFAEPGTITGSIGVVGGKIVTKGLWDWVGVTGKEYQRGKFADLMNTNRKYSDAQRELIQNMMNRIYGEFKDRVKKGRGDRIEGDIEKLAGGRVYTGKQALELGLVDRLGGMADAIKMAADEAELRKYDVRVYPRPKTILDLFTESFSGKSDEDKFIKLGAAQKALGARFAGHPALAGALDAIRAIDPQKAKAVQNFLVMVELLSNEGVLLIGPAFTTLR